MKVKVGFLLITFILVNQLSVSQTIIGNDSIDRVFRMHLEQTTLHRSSQVEIDEEDVLKAVDQLPAFGVFRDTYFITGIPLSGPINENTADAMFRISIRHRLTKSRLPFNSFLYVTYTQKSFWDIYARSSPFRDSNYNPAIGVGKYIIRDNKFKGTVFSQVEHESNGQDTLDSRSWNMISFSTKYFYNLQLSLGFKVWIPLGIAKENKDLADYKGFCDFSVSYITKDTKWWITAHLNPRKGFGNVNTTLTAGFKISEKANQYIYARFYNGKGDSLLDYNKYNMNIRIGFCIKPDFGSVF